MKHAVASAVLFAAVVTLAGCLTPATVKPTTTASSTPGPKATAAATVVTGKVVAPANLIGQAGGNFISTNGGTVIATGGLNVIATGGLNYKALQAGETLISGAEVFLADAGGNPFPSLPTVKSNGDGVYTIPNVPADLTYLVVVRLKTTDGKTAQMQTLVRSTKLGATADVGGASTLVTAAVVGKLKGALGELDQAGFSRAIATVQQHASKDNLPDWTDSTAVLNTVERFKAEIADLKAQLDTVQRSIEKLQASVDDLTQRVDELEKSPSPAPSASTPPAPATPTPSASAPPGAVSSGSKFEAQFSSTLNPNGPWEYMWRYDDDWQKMRLGENAEKRVSWIAQTKDATVSYGNSYIEDRVFGDGWINLKPRDAAAAGFRWTAPQDGTVKVELRMEFDKAVGNPGNGVNVLILTDHGPDVKGKSTILEQVFLPTDKPLFLTPAIPVLKGDRILLGVTSNDDGEGDETRIQALMTY